MKSLFLLFILLLTLGCNHRTGNETSSENKTSANGAPLPENAENKKAENSVASLYTLEPATQAAFDRAAANSTIHFTMDKDAARKINGVITLKINGEWKPISAFSDTLLNTDNSDKREFRYLGQHQKLNKYLVAGIFHGKYETYLVDKTTGEMIATLAEPIASPDEKFLANASLATPMEQVPNCIQVWRVIDKGKSTAIEKYFQLEQPDWEAFELYWELSQALIIKTMPMNKYESLQAAPKEEDFSYLRLKLK